MRMCCWGIARSTGIHDEHRTSCPSESQRSSVSGDVPGVARGIVYFAMQGALIGAAIPYVAAVGLLCYRDLASTLGGDDAPPAPA